MKLCQKRIGALAGFLAGLVSQVHAASGTWYGTLDNVWTTTNNWNATAVPGAGDTATFSNDGNGNTNVNIGAGVTVATLAIASGAGPYTFNGTGNLTATVAISNGAEASQTFNVPFTAPYIQEYNLANTGSGDLVFNGTYGFSSTRRGNFSGTGNIYLNGGTVNTEWCRKLGPNTLSISNNVQFQYEMTFCEGTVNYSATNQNSGSYAYFIVGDQSSKRVAFNLNGGLLTRQLNNGTGWGGKYYPMVLGYAWASTGIVNQTGGVMNNLGNSKIGLGHFSYGEYSISGGVYSNQDDIIVGYAGTNTLGRLTISGGTVVIGPSATKWLKMGDADSARGQLDISGGALNLMNNTCVKMTTGAGTGGCVVNQSGGWVTAFSDSGATVGGTGTLDLKYNSGPTCTNVYNLNGGVLTIPQIISSAATGTRTFNFNGGTLRAAATQAAFINLGAGAARANVRGGGAIIDSNGKDVTVAQPLLHSNIDGDAPADGGLAKVGAGALTLAATNTYSGATTVSSGTLTLSGAGSVNGSSGITVSGAGAKFLQLSTVAVTPAILLTQGTLDGTNAVGAVTVGNGTGGVVVNGNGGLRPLTAASLAFGGSATVNIRTDGTAPGLVVSGALSTAPGSGTVTLNVPSGPAPWVNGVTYNLIKFGSFGGSVTDFAKGAISGLGARQSATLGVDSVNGYITLTIGGDMPYWTGEAGADWTTNVVAAPKNWRLNTAGTAVDFLTDDAVVFDDRAVGNTTVSVAENVSPVSTVFENATNAYTLTSAGGFGIAGGYVAKNGTGSVTFVTANTYSGNTTISAGTLQLGNGVADGSLAAGSAIANSGRLVYNPASPQVVSNAISGAGAVVKKGPGSVALCGANTLTGDVTLEAGTLGVNHASALGNTAAGSLTISGGTLDNTSGSPVTTTAAKAQVWAEDFSFTGTGSLNFNGGAATIPGSGARTVQVAASTLTVGSLSSTNAGLTKTGAGTLALGAAVSSLTGTLTVAAGKVQIGANDLIVTGLAGSGTVENGSASARWLYVNNAADNVFSGLLQNGGSGMFGFCKSGGGAMTLTATNTYTDRTTVRGGTLSVGYLANTGAGCNLGAANALYLGDNVGTATLLYTGPDVTVDRGFTANANANNSAVIDTASRLTFTAGVNGANSGGFVKRGSGTLTLANAGTGQRINNGTGGGANVYGANIANGKLALKNGAYASAGETVVGGQLLTGGAYTAGALDISDGAVYYAGTWFSLGRGNGTNGLSSVVTVNGGMLSVASAASGLAMGYSGGISGLNVKPVLTLRGTGVVAVAGNLNCAENAGSEAQINVQDAALLSVSNAAIDAKRIGYSGKGSLNVAGGTVLAGAGLTLGAMAGSAGTVNLNGGTLDTAALVKGAGASATLNFNGGTLRANAGSTNFLAGLSAVNIYAGGATLDAQSHSVSVEQPLRAVEGNGVAGVSGIADATLYTVAPHVTFSAPESGTDLATGYALLATNGALAGIAVSHAGSGYSAAPAVSLNGLPLAATVTLGAMSGGGLMLKGSGTNALGGASTYTGATVLDAGTLLLTGSLQTGSLSVTNGATLAGTGSASNAAVSVSASSTLAPGTNGVGTLAVGSLELKAGAKIAVDFNADGTCDKIASSGTLALNGLSLNDLVFSLPPDVRAGAQVLVDAASVSGSLGSPLDGVLIERKKRVRLAVDTASGNLLLIVRGTGTLVLVF